MGERKREPAQSRKLARHHHSVDNINRLRDTSAAAGAGVGAGAGGDGGGDGDGGGEGVVMRERDRPGPGRQRDRQSAYLNRDTAGKPNRFGWRSWSSHRLSDLTAKKVFGWLKEPSSSSGKDGPRVTTVVATPGQGSDRTQEVSYSDTKVVGNGNFGVVYQAKLCDSGEQIAIKKVLQDKRFKNRELHIMRRLEHSNIVKLKYFFYSSGDQSEEVYLNLVLEYLPETVHKVARRYKSSRQTIPISFIKLYMYQLFRALAYIHSMDICHRDIKPPNLLVEPESGVLKLIDFGSAKVLAAGESNVAYICSRHYRAPELIFGATNYTTSIDVWSAGCVLAELLLGRPIFAGDNSVNQLVEVIKQLGTPTREQLTQMNPNYKDTRFPEMRARPWQKLFRALTPPEAIDLVSQLLQYTPQTRLTPLQACCHPFFSELREPQARLPNGRPLPPLFNFTEHELKTSPSLNGTLVPPHARTSAAAKGSLASPPAVKVSPPAVKVSPPAVKASTPAVKVSPPAVKVSPPAVKASPLAVKASPARSSSQPVAVRLPAGVSEPPVSASAAGT